MGSVCSSDEQHPLNTYYVPGAVGVLARSPAFKELIYSPVYSFIHSLTLAHECIYRMSLLHQAPCWGVLQL